MKKNFALLLIGLLLVGSANFLGTQAQTTDNFRYFKLYHPDKELPFVDYKSLNYEQKTAFDTEGNLIVGVFINDFPESLTGKYPISLPAGFPEKYLAPSAKIQSNAKEIVSIAQEITGTKAISTQQEVVLAVLSYCRNLLRWGNPNAVPDALSCLADPKVNCIGFVHLPAAILRNLGIPARTVRVFKATPQHNRLIPHYLLEIYFPEMEGWMTFEPQSPLKPSDADLFLYHHHDWDMEGQKRTRPFARDTNLKISGGIKAINGVLDFLPPVLKSFHLPDGDELTKTSGDIRFRAHLFDSESAVVRASITLRFPAETSIQGVQDKRNPEVWHFTFNPEWFQSDRYRQLPSSGAISVVAYDEAGNRMEEHVAYP